MAGCGGEAEGRGVRIHLGVQLEEGFVHAPQLFGAQVLVVNGPADAAVHGEGKRPDGVQQVGVRQLAGVQVQGGPVAPEEGPEGREAQLGAACVRAELAEDEREAAPEVGMGRTAAPLSQGAEPVHRVVSRVALPGVGKDGRMGVAR